MLNYEQGKTKSRAKLRFWACPGSVKISRSGSHISFRNRLQHATRQQQQQQQQQHKQQHQRETNVASSAALNQRYIKLV